MSKLTGRNVEGPGPGPSKRKHAQQGGPLLIKCSEILFPMPLLGQIVTIIVLSV